MIKVISFANLNHVGLINLQKSIQPGWKPVVIGSGEKWEGWITRMNAYKEFCANLPEKELVVLCDAYDVLCLRDSAGFSDIFATFGTDIVVGAESSCALNCHSPVNWWEHNNVPNNQPTRYFNGGLIAGLAGALAKMWQWIIEQKCADDQIGIGLYADQFVSTIHLDMNSKMFFNDHLAQTNYKFNAESRSIVLNNNILRPFFIHFQGVNIDSSVPFFNIFRTSSQFQVGKNYVTVGKAINGSEHLTAYPADKRGSVLGICIERGVVAGLAILFILTIVACIVIDKRKKTTRW